MPESLSDLRARFTQSLQDSGRAHATVIAYSKDVEQIVQFLAQKEDPVNELEDITSNDLEEFKDLLKTQRYTGKSISRKINAIKSFFRYLIAEGLIKDNPAEVVAHPKFDLEPPRILSKLEYRALRDACRSDLRIYAIVEVLLQTGLRISELAVMQLADLDLDRNLILIKPQNSRESRRVPLNTAARTALDDYLKVRPRAREKTVFLTKTCRPFLVRNIRTALDRYFRLAGIKDSKVNDLRHTFIVEQLKAGTPLVYVSQLVGHKRITTTEKYLKMIEAPDMNPTVKIEEL
jgi:site-specific recombinase XerD